MLTSARLPILAGAALGAALASGCASDPHRDGLTPHEFANVEHIAIYRGDTLPRYQRESVDTVRGVSCNRSMLPPGHAEYKVVTEYEALYDLKLEAADLGADAVVGVDCRRDDGGFRCRESVICTGTAVRADDGVGLERPSGDLAPEVTGEALTASPMLYRSMAGFTPDYLTEAQRAGLGRVGVRTPQRPPGATVQAPATGSDAAVQGAGTWFLQCVGQGGTFGLIISPLCAAIGAGLGTLSAESESLVRASSEAIAGTLKAYYAHESLRDRMLRAATQSGASSLALSKAVPAGDTPRDELAHAGEDSIDSVIEVGLEELLLPAWSNNGIGDAPVPVSLRARVRVIRLADGREIYNRSYGFVSDRRRYAEWGARNGALLRHVLDSGLQEMAERIVDDLLLVYPLMPVFGAASVAAPYEKRRYLIEPMDPPAHGYDFEGRPWPARVRTFEPRLRWRAFPGANALRADFQGKLPSISEPRYDLRVYRMVDARLRARLVLERNNLLANEYAVEQPLAPGSVYVWSVRARFRIDDAERVTRWAGDWLGRDVKGFLFTTPR